MFGKIIRMIIRISLELRKEKEFTIEEKKQLSEALRIPRISMGFAMRVCAEMKMFENNAC